MDKLKQTNVVLCMKSFKIYFPLFFFITFSHQLTAQPEEKNNSKEIKFNYQDLRFWAAHPSKYDPSDSVPESLKSDINNLPQADVFFIHPTTLTDDQSTLWNAIIEDVELNKKTDYSTILYQASAFNGNARIFAPRYRQVHIRGFYTTPAVVKDYFELAYQDIKNSFLYFIENENQGRPIIIASHSQGSFHAKRLLKEFFDGLPLQKQLVCAYIVGFPVEDNCFKKIPVCNDSTQTGCFVSWRTYKTGYTPEFIEQEQFHAVVVNPLSWNTDEKIISRNFNKGGVMFKFNKIIPGLVDAQISGNILWSCKPDIFGKFFIRKKNFHIGDINLFYMNIRENAKCRIKYFQQELNITNK